MTLFIIRVSTSIKSHIKTKEDSLFRKNNDVSENNESAQMANKKKNVM